VARLEQRFGGRLAEWGGPQVRLTPLGEQVLDKALDVLEAAADLIAATHRPAHRPYAVVGALYRMLVDDIAEALSLVDPLLAGDVSVEFREAADDDPSAGLARGRVDAAVLAGPTDLDALLVRRPVAQIPRVALLAAHHPLAARSGIEVRQLNDDTWVDDVAVPDASWPSFWRCDDVRGEAPRRRTPVSGPDQLIEAVRLGAGVVVRPSSFPVHHRLSGIVAVPLLDAPPSGIDLAYRMDSVFARFLDALADRVAADLDARPVGIRIRASQVVSGVVVAGHAPPRPLEEAAPRRRALFGFRDRRPRGIGPAPASVVDLTGSADQEVRAPGAVISSAPQRP
jgi:DNA-binding transcriptional LysR family regulator